MRCALACTLVILAATAATAGKPPEGIEEHAALPQPGGEPTLRLDVLLPRAVWGEWERVRLDYRILNATEKLIFTLRVAECGTWRTVVSPVVELAD